MPLPRRESEVVVLRGYSGIFTSHFFFHPESFWWRRVVSLEHAKVQFLTLDARLFLIADLISLEQHYECRTPNLPAFTITPRAPDLGAYSDISLESRYGEEYHCGSPIAALSQLGSGGAL